MTAAAPSADPYLLLQLGSRTCALPGSAVREILPLPRLWRPPGLPRPLAGFLNLGGAALPVLDLMRLFGLAAGNAEGEAALYRHVVVVTGAGRQGALGLLVDRALDLLRIPQAQLRPLAAEATPNGCAVAEIETPEGFVHLLAVERILLAQEQATLAALQENAQARLAEWAGMD